MSLSTSAGFVESPQRRRCVSEGPELPELDTPLPPEFFGLVELRAGVVEGFGAGLSAVLPGQAVEHLPDGITVGLDLLKKGPYAIGVSFGERRERIEGQEELVGLVVGDVENQNGHLGVGGSLGPEVPIDELKAIGRLAGE